MFKIVVLSIVLALMSSLLCACDIDEFKFTLHEDGKGYILEKYNSTSDSAKEDVIIPETYEGLPVIGIQNGAFSGNTALKSVVIPEGVKVIGCSAFGGCTELTSVTIPSSVTTIEDGAFEGCTSLRLIIVPQAVEIGRHAFKGCSSLTKMSFGMAEESGGYTIMRSAFENCTWLQTAEFGPCYSVVEGYAFAGCEKLCELTFSSGLETVKSHAFMNCKSLDYIYFRGTQDEMMAISKWPWWNLRAGKCTWTVKE